jgi:hypothetical protein
VLLDSEGRHPLLTTTLPPRLLPTLLLMLGRLHRTPIRALLGLRRLPLLASTASRLTCTSRASLLLTAVGFRRS